MSLDSHEELFDALVAPTLALVKEYSNQTEETSYTRLEEDGCGRYRRAAEGA